MGSQPGRLSPPTGLHSVSHFGLQPSTYWENHRNHFQRQCFKSVGMGDRVGFIHFLRKVQIAGSILYEIGVLVIIMVISFGWDSYSNNLQQYNAHLS